MSDHISSSASGAKPLVLNIPDKKDLYKSYMPFVKDGGLFIPFGAEKEMSYQPQQKVFIILKLPDNTKKSFSGKVIWIKKTSPNRGIGVSLGEGNIARNLKDTIETIIADVPKENTVTYTI